MSRSRTFKSEDWRQKLYRNQKMKKVEEGRTFQFHEPCTIKPGLLSTVLVLSLLLAPPGTEARVAREEMSSDKKSLSALAKSKMIKDPALSISEKNALDCSAIPTLFETTAKKLPIIKPDLERFLNEPTFNLICSTPELIAKKDKHRNDAITTVTQDHVNLTLSSFVGEDVLSHECTHITWFILHRSSACYEKTLTFAMLPYYPISLDRNNAYLKALDKGDVRIKEYGELQRKSALTPSEKSKLAVYDNATKDCLLISDTMTLNKELYDEFFNEFAKKPNRLSGTISRQVGNEKELLVIPRFTNYNTKGLTLFYRADASKEIVYENSRISAKVANLFPDDIILQMIERDAYTFQALSEQARKTFYPEAHALREAELQKCAPTEKRRLEL